VPVFFRYIDDSRNKGLVNLKISTSDITATIAKIEQAWKTVDKVHPLNATFYDDAIEKAYSEISAVVKMIAVLATLAISIASLGLLGMVVFTTESRLREISVRKVLGASESSLILLLSRGFVILLGIATTVALPVTYLLFDRVFLASVAYRAPIGVVELFSGVVLVMGIAFLMIWSQTWKVARTNPAEVLKAE
jgi:putative ABC transport system permease protein